MTARIVFIRERSSDTPPCGALTWPSSDEPVPNGTIGASCRAQSFTRSITSSRDLGEHDRVRRLVLEPGQRVAVLAADRLGGGEAIAEARGEVGVEGGDGFRREPALALADGEERFHGNLRLLVSAKTAD